jgi:hypothetical protein
MNERETKLAPIQASSVTTPDPNSEDPSAPSESEAKKVQPKLETEFLLKFVAPDGGTTWTLSADGEDNIAWQVDIPYPGSDNVPWIVTSLRLSANQAREIAAWLLARTGE